MKTLTSFNSNNGMLLNAFLLCSLALTACQKSNDSFSLLSEESTFKQSTSIVPRKIDILWVIDNSGSMATSQANIASNFSSFIQTFQTKNYDFQIGVTTTDAYFGYHYNSNNNSKLKNNSTYSILDKNTPNLTNNFIANITQGTSGSGDERAFMSMKNALQNPLNSALKRNGSFLAVIIVSDEEDFSHYDYQNGISSYYFTENYSDPNLYSVQSYVDFLSSYTNSTAQVKNFSVSTINIQDAACLALLGGGRKISTRYGQLADATGGTKASLCGNFAASLQAISDTVLALSSVFQLDREPIESTISITVNGVAVAKSATNGWSYIASTNSIAFNGTAIPPADANIKVNFDPKTVKQ